MGEVTELRRQKTVFQKLVRRLAEEAMSVTHHDASPDEPGYVHEVDTMERRFSNHIRAFMSARTRKQNGRSA